jgi:hypothetical protein
MGDWEEKRAILILSGSPAFFMVLRIPGPAKNPVGLFIKNP